MGDSITEKIIKELTSVFEIIGDRICSSIAFLEFARELGWEFPHNQVPGFSELIEHISNLANSLSEFEELSSESYPPNNLATLADDFFVVIEDIRNIGTKFSSINVWPDTIDIEQFVSEFPQQLLNYAVVQYFEQFHPGIYALLRMTETICVDAVEPPAPRLPYTSYVVDLGRLLEFISNPKSSANLAYEWGTDQFDAQEFLNRLEEVCLTLGIPAGQYLPHPTIASRLLEITDPTYAQMGKELRIPVYEVPDSDIGYVEAGINIYPIPDKQEPPGKSLYPGIALIPYINGSVGEAIQLGGGFELKISGDLSAGIAVEVRPGKTTGKANLLGTQAASLNGELKVTISRPKRDESIRIFDGPGDSYLAIQDISHSIGVTVTSQNETDVYWELNLNGGEIVVSAGEGDGFLQKILPSDGIKAGFDITTGWSSERGIYFRGSATLEITIPLHKTLGPLTLKSIYISINIGQHISTVLAVSAIAQIGPIVASVERIGIDIPIILKPNNDGNLGPIHINKPQFLPPSGVGLAVEAGPIVGGGYLEIDNINKRYAGILQLQMGEIGLTAIGLITTRLPDGSDGFSMLISIATEFTPEIQLSFGFTLAAVGGIIGINRTTILDVLRDGVRNRTLDSILFPQNPIQNANNIISDLRAVFPPEEDRFVVGPMLRLGWGSPRLITAELAVVMELPAPLRIFILGQFAATFPDEEHALVELHLDVLGAIDFGKETLSIDATLFDSRVMAITLSGDAALRLNWGKPEFALSLGGFHPKFLPPPDFPVLQRLRLSLGSGNNPRITCEHYQALTSNSLQFGAKAELYVRFSEVKVHGYMGFDALFYFSPFGFDVAISAGVAITVAGANLLSVKLYFQLAGPTPWHAEGEANVEILFFDISVHFDVTWGSREAVEIPPVNPWDDLVAALERAESWGTALPQGLAMVESLRSLERKPEQAAATVSTVGAATPPAQATTLPPLPLLVHPGGTLEIRQKVLPLNQKLYMYGNAPISGPDTYDITVGDSDITAGDSGGFETLYLEDYFARGQYEKLSNTDKVSKPSYELMKNGLAIRAKAVKFDDNLTQEYVLEYESNYIDDDNITQTGSSARARMAGKLVQRLLVGAASRQSGLRTAGLGKYKSKGANKISVAVERYRVVRASDMTKVAGVAGNDGTMSRMAADEARRSYINDPRNKDRDIIVVPEFEVAA